MNKVSKILLILLSYFLVWYAFCLPRQLFTSPRSATLLDRDGTLMGARIASDGQWRFGPSGEVPPKFAECLIHYEDKRFRRHSGVDLVAAGRALRQNISGGRVVSGASTITMQVIRLSRGDAPRTIPEKIYEMILATRLELRCSKDEILQLYAANAPFGGNVVGLEAASWRYFGCPASDLSWAETATLAVLPNAPALIHPGRNRETLLKKRNFLLDKLCECGTFDATECELAKDEPLPDKPHPMPDCAYHLLERGRKIHGDKELRSTLDPALQQRVNAIAARHFALNHTNLVDNMGIIVVDIKTGKTLAYYGNTRGLAPSLRGADVDMIPAARSSGSTLKPMLYAAMLQDGSILPSSLIKDTPYNYNNFSPRNFSLGYDGAVPAHEVIERSLNVPSVRMLEQYGAQRFLELLHGMGFHTINRDADHYGLSLILGGAEISLETLAGAYYRMSAKLSGEKVYKALQYFEGGRRVRLRPESLPLSEGAIWLAFDALSNANRPEEESSWMSFSSSRKIAWKTGTSWGSRDAWSVGTDGGSVVAVWVGNSDGEGRSGLTGVSYAAPVMFDVFSCLDPGGWFPVPEHDMRRTVVCQKSGLPASRFCPERDTILTCEAPAAPAPCPYHRVVRLSPDKRYQVNSDCCPVADMIIDTFFVLPPAQEWYYKQRHLDYRPLPPRHPSFDASSADHNPIEIIYPGQGITIVSTRGLDGKKKGGVFKAAHSDPGATLYWHLDEEFIGQTTGEHELMVAPAPGDHVLTVTDGEGFRRTVFFHGE